MDAGVEFVEAGEVGLHVTGVFESQKLFVIISYFLTVGKPFFHGS